ncbi:ABC transporter [Haladaptatus sp. R4]|nr:ABC transporter [Haladaptatus sp. R4]
MVLADIRLQVRYGLYLVYAILTGIFIVGLQLRPAGLRTDLGVLVIVSNPTSLGFYFIATLIIFEKTEGVLDALVVSSLTVRDYLLSKAVTLSLIAISSGVLIALFVRSTTPRIAILIIGIALSAPLFVFIGVIGVARFDSINQYFLSSVVWAGVLFVPPIFGYLGFVHSPLLYLLPTKPVLLIVEAGFRPIAHWKLLYAISYLLIGDVVAYKGAKLAFEKYIVRGETKRPSVGFGGRISTRQRGNRELVPSSPWKAMARADFRNLIRDPLLWFTFLTPLLLALMVRFGVPWLATMAGPAIPLHQYYSLIVGSMALAAPGIFGFVIGIIVLEDREQSVLTAYVTSPLSSTGYLGYRFTTTYLLSVIVTIPTVWLTGLIPVPPAIIVGTAAVSSLTAPLFAFSLGAVASNTVEGIAVSKFANIIMLGPSAVIALVPEPIQFAIGVLPMYWPVKAFVVGVGGGGEWIVYLLLGVCSHGIAISVFGWWFIRHAK